jgi:excisionase family DNA binding protein
MSEINFAEIHYVPEAASKQAPIELMLLTTRQTAEALNVSERTVFNLIDSGKLFSVKIGDLRRIPLEDVKQLARTGAEIPKQ